MANANLKINISALKGLDYTKAQTDEFHTVFGHPIAAKPTALTQEQIITRARFIMEELVELTATVVDNAGEHFKLNNKLIEAINDAEEKQKTKGFRPETELEQIVAQSDALTDINYFTQGTFTMNGVKPQPLFDIVQEANMSKLGPDKKPIYRESDGKIMKPEGWQPPEPKLTAEIEKQIAEAK